MQDFVKYYNHRRDHEAIGNVTAADVYYGAAGEILRMRAKQKQCTTEQRLRYNLGRVSKMAFRSDGASLRGKSLHFCWPMAARLNRLRKNEPG
jgi:hypothetical protein